MLSPEEIVAGQLAAYNARDLERFLGFYVDDVPVATFPAGEVMADRSGTEFRERYRELFDSCPDLHAKLVTRVVHGRIVIDHELVTGVGNGESRSTVAMYEVGREKIERVWFVL
ncbi:MAG: nuclear transport factor 2 family protein [Umezawaea sp.]